MLVALATAMIGVRAGFLLHEAVAANVRAGVSSGANTLSWLIFLPVSLTFGWIASAQGVATAGWLVVVIAAAAIALLVRTTHDSRTRVPDTESAVVPEPTLMAR